MKTIKSKSDKIFSIIVLSLLALLVISLGARFAFVSSAGSGGRTKMKDNSVPVEKIILSSDELIF